MERPEVKFSETLLANMNNGRPDRAAAAALSAHNFL